MKRPVLDHGLSCAAALDSPLFEDRFDWGRWVDGGERGRCDDMAYRVFGGVDYSEDFWLVGGEVGYRYGGWWGVDATGDVGGPAPSGRVGDQNGTNGTNGASERFYYGFRLGLNFWQKRLTPYITGGFQSRQTDFLWRGAGKDVFKSVDPYYGLGVEYDFWRLRGWGSLLLRGEWERFDLDRTGEVDFYGMNVLYEFNL